MGSHIIDWSSNSALWRGFPRQGGSYEDLEPIYLHSDISRSHLDCLRFVRSSLAANCQPQSGDCRCQSVPQPGSAIHRDRLLQRQSDPCDASKCDLGCLLSEFAHNRRHDDRNRSSPVHSVGEWHLSGLGIRARQYARHMQRNQRLWRRVRTRYRHSSAHLPVEDSRRLISNFPGRKVLSFTSGNIYISMSLWYQRPSSSWYSNEVRSL